jgi:adenylylsulfate kinase-like enzyme
MARSLFEPDEFVEVFVDVPFDECSRRDVKGLYAKALRGELKNFTGLDSPYEAPTSPDVHLLAAQKTMDECVEQLLQALR